MQAMQQTPKQMPHFINYDFDFRAPKRVLDKVNTWNKNKDIKTLLTQTELFGGKCADRVWGTPLAILNYHEDREDLERLRCILANSILENKNFKIYVIPTVHAIVYLKKQPEGDFFDINLSDKEDKIRDYKLLSKSRILHDICQLANINLKITQEKCLVRFNSVGAEPKDMTLNVLNFEFKDDLHLPATHLMDNCSPGVLITKSSTL